MKILLQSKSSGWIRIVFSALAIASLWVTALPSLSHASTAANTVIRNTVTVNYQDTASHAMPSVQGSVDITVSLVYASPTLNAPTDQSTVPGTPAAYNYTISSNANGPDTYTIATNIDSQSGGISGSTAVPSSPIITLGGTTIAAAVTIAATGTTAIAVPNDGAPDSSVNGIVDGDTVVINGQAYTVASITDNGGTVGGTSTITVNGNGTSSGALSVGAIIGERQTFTMTVTPGTVTAAANQTITVTTSAKGGGAPVATTDPTVTTVNVASLTVVKEVSTDGNTWATSGVSAAPGATLYYRLTVTNNGSSDATNVVITDPQPLYTTYAADSAKRATGAAVSYSAAPATLTDATDADGYDFGKTTTGVVTYNVGTISAGAANAVQLFFRVTVN